MCGPKLWNKLPLELRQKCSVESFKKGLKTHLFKEAYNIWTVLIYLKNVFYKYFRLLCFAFMYICILYSFMYACKILAPILFHSCIAHWAVWNCALKEFIIIINLNNYISLYCKCKFQKSCFNGTVQNKKSHIDRGFHTRWKYSTRRPFKHQCGYIKVNLLSTHTQTAPYMHMINVSHA